MNLSNHKLASAIRRSALLLLCLPLLSNAQLLKDRNAKPEEKKGLRIEYYPDAPRPRSKAPANMEVRISGVEPGEVLEGRLRVIFRDDNTAVAHYESPELALASGTATYRFTVPETMASGYTPTTSAHFSFVTKKKTIEIGEVSTPLPNQLSRNLVVATCVPAIGEYENLQEVLQLLRLEKYDPEKDTRVQWASLSTVAARLRPEQFPSQPLSYCAYDTVLLAGVGFKSLRDNQLDALATWVRGGGSACVIVSEKLDRTHEQFLNALSGNAFTADDEGRLDSPSPDAHQYFEPGLGRLCVIVNPTRESITPESAAWRRTVGFVFHFREAQMQHLVDTQTWSWELESPPDLDKRGGYRRNSYYNEWGREQHGNLQLQPFPGNVAGKLGEQLLPRNMKMLPGSLIFFILLLFILVIGPLDYIVLGKLKKRKYTWIVFPLMSILFTLIMVKLAEHYMGTNDHRRVLRIVDVTPEGEVLRENRLNLIFTSKHKTLIESGKNALLSVVNDEGLGAFGTRYGAYSDDIVSTDQQIRYAGRIPGNFEMSHNVKQWTPAMVRELHLGAQEETAPGLWPLPANALDTPEHLAAHCASFASTFDGKVFLSEAEVKGKDSFQVFGDSNLYFDTKILRDLCIRPRLGFFSLVYHVSPHGGGMFEDLCLQDETDPSQTVIATVSETRDEVVVYRCLIKRGTE